MFTFRGSSRFRAEDIGKIHYSSYWKTYSIILDVKGNWIWEQTLGADQYFTTPNIRRHCTPFSRDDKLMSTQEYVKLMKTDK